MISCGKKKKRRQINLDTFLLVKAERWAFCFRHRPSLCWALFHDRKKKENSLFRLINNQDVINKVLLETSAHCCACAKFTSTPSSAENAESVDFVRYFSQKRWLFSSLQEIIFHAASSTAATSLSVWAKLPIFALPCCVLQQQNKVLWT